MIKSKFMLLSNAMFFLSGVILLCIVTIIFMEVVRCMPKEDKNIDEDGQDVYETRYPYPKEPIEMNWSYEMGTRPYDQPKVHTEINNLLTQLIETLSFGDPKKKSQLTLKHNWVPFSRAHCFDSLRLMLSMYCVEWRLSEYARRYGYVLVNMCNAVWLNQEDIEEGMARACENKRIPDEKCM